MFQLPVRVGELKNLKWDNIDLESRTLIIDGQVLEERKMNDDLSFSKQEVISVNHTKKNTPQGKRRLWLTKEAINILETAKSINPYGAFVFMPNDSLMLTDTFNRRLKKYTSEAGGYKAGWSRASRYQRRFPGQCEAPALRNPPA